MGTIRQTSIRNTNVVSEYAMVKRWIAQGLFWPTYAWNLTWGRLFKVRRWWDVVDEVVVLGARPLRRDVKTFHETLHITGVINMCEEYCGPTDLYEQFGIEQLWLPTVDFTPPNLGDVERGVEFIEQHAQKNGRVYVHCKAGRARSATVVLCWLVKYRGMTPQEAQEHLLKVRPHVHSKLPERAVVQEFVRLLGK